MTPASPCPAGKKKPSGSTASACPGTRANIRFATLEEFSLWLDKDLERLEAQHEAFVTNRSLRDHLGR